MSFKPPQIGDSLATTYDDSFFRQHEKFRYIYEHLAALIREFSPQKATTIVDVGCGHCILLEALGQHFKTATGIDGSSKGIPPHMRERVSVIDMSQAGWASAAMPTTDVVVCLETAEHLPAESGKELIRALVSQKPLLVVFSAATPYQDLNQNPGHLNEQRLSYWVEQFEAQGFTLLPEKNIPFRARLSSNQIYAPLGWYPKNLLLFTPGESTAVQFKAQDRMLVAHPLFQLVADRDILEFELLMLKRLCVLKR
jgi:SAM-dependent methyltransferase